MADEPTIAADTDKPNVPFVIRRSGSVQMLRSPLSPEQVDERFALYLGAGKKRQDLARVQGRTVVAKRTGGHVQMAAYRRYLLGVLTTALCVVEAAPTGSQVFITISTMRYRRLYTVGVLTAGIVAILVFAPANELWLRTLLAFGVLLVASSWRFSRPTRETIAERKFLAEFVRNLLEAEEVETPRRKRTHHLETATSAKGRSD